MSMPGYRRPGAPVRRPLYTPIQTTGDHTPTGEEYYRNLGMDPNTLTQNGKSISAQDLFNQRFGARNSGGLSTGTAPAAGSRPPSTSVTPPSNQQAALSW